MISQNFITMAYAMKINETVTGSQVATTSLAMGLQDHFLQLLRRSQACSLLAFGRCSFVALCEPVLSPEGCPQGYTSESQEGVLWNSSLPCQARCA